MEPGAPENFEDTFRVYGWDETRDRTTLLPGLAFQFGVIHLLLVDGLHGPGPGRQLEVRRFCQVREGSPTLKLSNTAVEQYTLGVKHG